MHKSKLFMAVACALAMLAAGVPAPASDIPIDLATIPKITSSAAGSAAAEATSPAPAATKPTATDSNTATADTTTPKPASTAAAVPGAEPGPAKDAETQAQDAAAEAAAANVAVDLSSIPKVDVTEPVVSSGGSTSVGQGNAGATKRAATKIVPLTDFDPAWPTGKPINANQLLVDVVTDSPIDVIRTNQIPFIQSLADALGVSTNQVYWYNLTESDLNTATFLVDSNSDAAQKSVLGNLANPDNTARFYTNAAAYTLNILNGPEVAPQELNLGTDVISTPDNYKAYNGDTGLISNNATAASSAQMPGGGANAGFASMMLALSAALMLALVMA